MAKAKQLESGNWRVLLYTGKENGKRKYKSFTAATKKEAEYLAAEYSVRPDTEKKSGDMTLGEAIDKYIEVKEGVLSPKTTREYKRFRKLYAQNIMDIKIYDLTSDDLQKEISRESQRLAPKSIRNVYGLISASLSMFQPEVKYKVLLPQKVKKEMRIPEGNEINTIFAAVAGTRLEIPVYLGACLGLRRSEIAALDLDKDVDYDHNTVTINKAMVNDSEGEWVIKAPKAFSSYRKIEAPAFLIEKLKAARDAEYVPMNPAHITSAYLKKMEKIGCKGIRFHDLRHYYASVMLSLGVPDKYAMERMGHATPNMLKSVYQHLMDEKRNEVSSSVNGFFQNMQHEMQHESENTPINTADIREQ